MAICGRKTWLYKWFVVMGIKRSVLKSLIQRSKRFVKIFKNMRYRRNKVEKIREITKSPFSLVFQLHLFFRNFFFPTEFGLERWSFDDHFDIKNTLTGVFITKGHFQWSILIWAQNAFCKCFLESKIFKIYFTLIKYFTCLS